MSTSIILFKYLTLIIISKELCSKETHLRSSTNQYLKKILKYDPFNVSRSILRKGAYKKLLLIYSINCFFIHGDEINAILGETASEGFLEYSLSISCNFQSFI